MKKRHVLAAAAVFAIAAALSAFGRMRAPGLEGGAHADPEIIAATFRSAWCPACQVLEPKLARVIPDFANQPVAFAEFDFTFGPTADLEAKAAGLGLGDLYARNKGATGFTLIVDADTGEIVDVLTMNFSEGAMRAAIAQALAHRSHTDHRAPPGPSD